MAYQTLISVMVVSQILFMVVTMVEAHSSSSSSSGSHHHKFVKCLSTHSPSSTTHLYTNHSPKFLPLLQSTQQVTRWLNSSIPLFIITPTTESEIQAAVICSKKHGLEIRTKSGGHDYEGLSYRSQRSYIIIDMYHFRQVHVDVADEVAWVQAGATLGELYYAIGKKSPIHAFPGGTCPSVGTGGLISGGGLGWLVRKFGLAADNVLDARIVDAYGRLLDRKTMGEGLFWAIRGGGGASFGVITSWKLKLVRVPPLVTVFTSVKYLNESATELIYKWQTIAPKLPRNLVIRVLARLKVEGEEKLIKVNFQGFYQGGKVQLMKIMNKKFPSLSLLQSDCNEMPWINSTTLYLGSDIYPLEKLLNRTDKFRSAYKGKSDFAKKLIPQTALKGIWKLFMQIDFPLIIMEPLGGKMNEISTYSLPFPYRKRYLFNLQYLTRWDCNQTGCGESLIEKKQTKWMNKLYKYMSSFVSHSPRGAYMNYRDLDLGKNRAHGQITFSEAKLWGEKYFGHNFNKLCRVKKQVDPENFFRHEQSIPPLFED